MNIEESIDNVKFIIGDLKASNYNQTFIQAIEILLTAYEKEKGKKEELIKERAKEIIYVDRNFIRKDNIKPIQIIDLDGKIHNLYRIEEE